MEACPRCSAPLGTGARCPECGAPIAGRPRAPLITDGWTMLGLFLVFPGLTCFFKAWPGIPTGGHGRVRSAIDWSGRPDPILLAIGIVCLAGFAIGLFRLARQRR